MAVVEVMIMVEMLLMMMTMMMRTLMMRTLMMIRPRRINPVTCHKPISLCTPRDSSWRTLPLMGAEKTMTPGSPPHASKWLGGSRRRERSGSGRGKSSGCCVSGSGSTGGGGGDGGGGETITEMVFQQQKQTHKQSHVLSYHSSDLQSDQL